MVIYTWETLIYRLGGVKVGRIIVNMARGEDSLKSLGKRMRRGPTPVPVKLERKIGDQGEGVLVTPKEGMLLVKLAQRRSKRRSKNLPE